MLCSPKLRVYTVQKEGHNESEYEKFSSMIPEFPETRPTEIKSIVFSIEEMKKRGAKEYFFKKGKRPPYLPKLSKDEIEGNENTDYGIRLYILKLKQDTY